MIESTKTRLVQLKRRRLLSLVNNCGSKIPAAAAASSAATPAATPPHNSRTDGGAGVGAAVGTVGAGLGAGVGVGAFNALLSGAQHKLLPGDEVVPETKCNVPFIHSWGDGWQHHNALVYSVNRTRGVCTVLFTTPTHVSMLPCPHFLSGKCRFRGSHDDGAAADGTLQSTSAQAAHPCRYSHGYPVDMTQV